MSRPDRAASAPRVPRDPGRPRRSPAASRVRPARRRPPGATCPCSAPACRDTARRVRSSGGGEPSRRAPAGRRCRPGWGSPQPRRGQLRRAPARSAAIVVLTAITASARASPAPLARQVAAHVGNHRQRQRPRRAGARPDAAASSSPAEQPGQSVASSRGVDQVRPVADRPVVAHGADRRRTRRGVRRLDRRQAGHARAARGRCRSRSRGTSVVEVVASERVQPLVLEVVAHVRHAAAPACRTRGRGSRRSRVARGRPASRAAAARRARSWPRARRPRASS